jgi:hypothetical protein
MAIGRKTGGRKAGTPNRKTKEIGGLLESLGCNPIEGMVRIANDPRASLELRGRMNAELAQYVYPKRKAVEHSGTEEASFTIIFRCQETNGSVVEIPTGVKGLLPLSQESEI